MIKPILNIPLSLVIQRIQIFAHGEVNEGNFKFEFLIFSKCHSYNIKIILYIT